MKQTYLFFLVFGLLACAQSEQGIDAPLGKGVDDNNSPCERCAIYVDGEEGDDAHWGTLGFPVQSVSRALVLAKQNEIEEVRVAAGEYYESVKLPSHLTLKGGYDGKSWQRGDDPTVLRFANKPVSVWFAEGVVVENIHIESEDAEGTSRSSTALLLVDADVELREVIIRAGRGSDGSAGNSGADGASGGDGGMGEPGCENSNWFCASCSRPQGGRGGFSSCGERGGEGGLPGLGSRGGESGHASASTLRGGLGGSSGADGARGLDGTPGYWGKHGVGGKSLGEFTDLGDYVPAHGLSGVAGTDGRGGSGGGGGGGGTADCDSYGSSGGGGGGGGCAGFAGTGGTGGGGSFGIVAIDSSLLALSVAVETSPGGAGGAGGEGGQGGLGGVGGAGGPFGGTGEQDDGGFGGAGGNGGRGGRGGDGGGGGGGPSIGIVCDASDVLWVSSSFTISLSGAGGESAAMGERGRRLEFYGCF